MSRKRNTRYGHAFSKGRVGFHSEGSWRQLKAARPGAVQPKAVMTDYPIPLDPARWRQLKVSPTVATVYRSHCGIAVVCASCLNGRGYRNPGLPDHFRRHWHLTLMEVEKRFKCGHCGRRNARVYPWLGSEGADLGLEGPPGTKGSG